jgi:DNA-binding transcriptional ArsR family regulator
MSSASPILDSMGVLSRNGDVPSPDVIREGGYQPTSDPGPVPSSLIRRGTGDASGGSDRVQGLGPSPSLAKALANPHRVSILRILSERDATVSELVRDLALSASQVAYQLKALRDWKIIEIVGEEPWRGSVVHRYRARTEAIRPVLETFAQESVDPD